MFLNLLLQDSGFGFDSKVSEDVLPSDLPSYDEYNLTPYDPDAEEDEEEMETDDEATDSKPEGESSDDDSSSSSDNDNEDTKENETSPSSTLARSAVSVYLNKSTASEACVDETQEEIPKDATHAEDKSKSAETGRRGWWKPLFGGGKKPKTPIQNNEDVSTSPKPSEETSDDQSEESKSKTEIMAQPKRCITPHGGSASEYEDDSSDDSDND